MVFLLGEGIQEEGILGPAAERWGQQGGWGCRNSLGSFRCPPLPHAHAQDLTLSLALDVLPPVGRKQFMRFEWANHAAEALGCEYEELNTATFKHHLRQIIQQVTSGSSQRMSPEQETSSGKVRTYQGTCQCAFFLPCPGCPLLSFLWECPMGRRVLGPSHRAEGSKPHLCVWL